MEQQSKDEALFLPFMQIPTGHHHVADAVMEELNRAVKTINCEKVDILSYSYGRIERLVSATYLHWIRIMPKAYDLLYHRLAVKDQTKRSRQILYEAMFLSFFKKLMRETEPNILFCTHCLPSNIASLLKEKGKLNAITVNVYTDFFVNRVWGVRGIDYHLVPSISVKNFLLDLGVEEDRIFITGIPVHPVFQEKQALQRNEMLHVLITGGSLGVGAMEKLIPANPEIKYTVLCGQNEKLYHSLSEWSHPYVQPIQYIESKEEMNHLYNQVDAVISKPGGVTVSECLMKRIPIFTCNALPGQEKVNELELVELGVINRIDPYKNNIELQLKNFFTNNEQQMIYKQKIDAYHNYLEKQSLSDILLTICP
ncbi:MGDG synthase family glycosyltransferase [Ornithinibacillus californiensis]|uniref:MGDG synthase family glycosyltransferase n=1 Tax=Ornithinibacillus californiensis TaxID=161536 RepID=UPI00064DD5B3|nr:UDP-glucuronosyltransferase [Ornithinibacillus californiensis]